MSVLERGKHHLRLWDDSDPPIAPPRPSICRWERVGWVLLVALLLSCLPIGLFRAVNQRRGTDFPEFYAAGRHVLEHREIQSATILKYYWPSADVAWAAVAWMPLPFACAVWYLFNCGACLGLLFSIRRWLLADVASPHARQMVLAAGLLMMPLVLDHLCLGAFHIVMIWLTVEGLGRASQGRDWSGGMVLGLAVWLKLLPMVGVGYLVIKRKWLPATVAVGCGLAINLALCLPVFGPQRTWELHQAWWRGEATGASHRLFDVSQVVDEDRLSNQSLLVVMRRVFTQMGVESSPARARIAVGDLSPRQLRFAYMGVLGAIGLAVLAFCGRSSRTTSAARWSWEIALIVLCTLWVSPVAWSYHATAAAPALAVIFARQPLHAWRSWMTIGLWGLAMALLGAAQARAVGATLWTSFFLASLMVWLARHPAEACEKEGSLPAVTPELRAAA